ncbi:Putative RNA methyltransferase At5g10620 [Auxenochlorella protothecoides]|nr:Putative RNA methyltransferase At5g10620 [Auxenochlorella protothecoides]KFM29290.1 Putative RNA methyltransferase At5g10620 [Auxenochlorella protothecoides]RMZ56045.1 hypothetical protein APUTEX25_004469 [Auxenochlorella protothecoides]|eukprot:RMZ56045.1 hypothetical protein APUTEX25_004469 [Auxenochlorella protothecoides]
MASEWRDKLQRYVSVEEVCVKPNPKNVKDPLLAVQHEGERTLAALPNDAYVVLLDERGKALTSPGLAALLTRASSDGSPRLAFLVGGPHGHHASVRARADISIRLSDMVLNHQVAHVVLLEQLYRAWTILKGSPYHH